MKVDFHRKFVKIFTKLPLKIKNKFYERLHLFGEDPFCSILNNHSVDDIYPGWRSINVTGDYRALFEPRDDTTIVFMKIGTHSELYK